MVGGGGVGGGGGGGGGHVINVRMINLDNKKRSGAILF